MSRHIGTIVKCNMDDCLYCENGECMRTEIYLSDDHVCDGGCDDGWEVANGRSNKQASGN